MHEGMIPGGDAKHIEELDKYKNYFHLLNHWMRARAYGHGIHEYLDEHGYKRVAVYGISDFANHIFDELQGTDIQVAYGIDREGCNVNSPIEDVYSPDDRLPTVDAVIVTTYLYIDEIRKVLQKSLDCPVVSLEKIVWSI